MAFPQYNKVGVSFKLPTKLFDLIESCEEISRDRFLSNYLKECKDSGQEFDIMEGYQPSIDERRQLDYLSAKSSFKRLSMKLSEEAAIYLASFKNPEAAFQFFASTAFEGFAKFRKRLNPSHSVIETSEIVSETKLRKNEKNFVILDVEKLLYLRKTPSTTEFIEDVNQASLFNRLSQKTLPKEILKLLKENPSRYLQLEATETRTVTILE